MADGNWIMAGLHLSPFAKGANLPTVAISRGEDFTKWDPVVIPAAPGVGTNVWGESTVIVEGRRITNLSRYGKRARALLSASEDYGAPGRRPRRRTFPWPRASHTRAP